MTGVFSIQHIEYRKPTPWRLRLTGSHCSSADTLQVPRAARPAHCVQVKAILCVGMNIGPALAPGRGVPLAVLGIPLVSTSGSPVAGVGMI